jgi:hypothetical protein
MGGPEGMTVARKTNVYCGWTISVGENSGGVSIVGAQLWILGT